MCHGSGLQSTTLSDLVVEVEYVDAKGLVQTVNDPKELAAASGAFGLLGVVISITLHLDAMNVTDMMPCKRPLPLAIPPPEDYPIPNEVKQMMTGITKQQLADARKEFIQRCENDYYLEWFWFPYQNDVWVNTWSSASEFWVRLGDRLRLGASRETCHRSRPGPFAVPRSWLV